MNDPPPVAPSIYRHLTTRRRTYPTWILLLGGRDAGVVPLRRSELGNEFTDMLLSSGKALIVHAKMDDIIEGVLWLKRYYLVFEDVISYVSEFCTAEGHYQGCPDQKLIRKMVHKRVAQAFVVQYYSRTLPSHSTEIVMGLLIRHNRVMYQQWEERQAQPFIQLINDSFRFLEELKDEIVETSSNN